MDLYSRKQRWKLLLAGFALLIVVASLWYSDRIVSKVREEERRKVELWAEAVRNRADLVVITERLFDGLRDEERKKVELYAEAQLGLVNGDPGDLGFYLKVVSDNTTVPVIITDPSGAVKFHRNLDEGIAGDEVLMQAELETMATLHDPIEIVLFGNEKQYLYYKDSRLFTELQDAMDGIISSFISETVMNTAAVPVVLADSTQRRIIAHSNLPEEITRDTLLLRSRMADMAGVNKPIEIRLPGQGKHFIFFEESLVITQLKYFPYVQLVIIGLFLLVSYFLFSIFRRAEQDQVWVGMAKETAHQLGTPLSSMMAWVDLLKAKEVDPEALTEMRKDLDRLDVITQRFSKIGSEPDLQPEKLYNVLRATVLYLRPRLPSQAKIEVVQPEDPDLEAPVSRPLFSWVVENLIRNAIDAMKGDGSITITIEQEGGQAHVDIEDTGKGIPAAQHRNVFEPGFTTKKRGWGLGLSLSKRIIEKYHGGRIFVKRSAPGKGTTFRITLSL